MRPAYNFQKQFVPKILDRSKPHTIRRRRKRPTVAGDTLMLYTGMRTKSCDLIAVSTCLRVEPIVIYPWKAEFLKADHQGVHVWLNSGEIQQLAVSDGFAKIADFFDFFKLYKRECLDDFELIHWDVGDLFMPVMGEPAGIVRLQLGRSK